MQNSHYRHLSQLWSQATDGVKSVVQEASTDGSCKEPFGFRWDDPSIVPFSVSESLLFIYFIPNNVPPPKELNNAAISFLFLQRFVIFHGQSVSDRKQIYYRRCITITVVVNYQRHETHVIVAAHGDCRDDLIIDHVPVFVVRVLKLILFSCCSH